MTELDPRALIAARTAFDDGEKLSDQLPSAIAAYLAATHPQAGEPVAWGTFARAICESEGRDWTALDNPREDCERWIKAGQACAALASPQPANPAQVTELIEEAKDFAERMTGQPWACELVEKLIDALTAAIGAGGQAVAVRPLEWVDADEGMCTKWRAAALGGHYELVDFGKDDPGFAVNFHWGRPLSFWFIQGEPDELGPTGPKIFPTLKAAKAAAQADYERRILSALSQPHPADERVVEALRIAEKALRPFHNATFNDNGDITVSGPFPHDETISAYLAYKQVEAALSGSGAGAGDIGWEVEVDDGCLTLRSGDNSITVHADTAIIFNAASGKPARKVTLNDSLILETNALFTPTGSSGAGGWREDRLPTHEGFKTAMAVILACNGFDLSQWTDDIWPDEGLETVAKYMRRSFLASKEASQ